MPLVPLVFVFLGYAAAFGWFALFLWTDVNAFGLLSGVGVAAAVGCFVWALFDSYAPLRWRQNRKDELDLLS